MKTVHILNPAAGQGKAADFKELENAYITKAPGDAAEYVKDILEDSSEDINFQVYGGDGTINEVVSGIMRSGSDKGYISVVPVGTGNDLVRSLETVAAEKIDVLTLNDRFAINAVNTGFDLEVVLKAAEYKKKPFISGALAYILGVVSVFTEKFGKKMHIEYEDLDGKIHTFDGECMLAVAANGCYYGGGFKASPAADVCDGAIDFMVIKKVSRMRFLSLVLGYKKGAHIDKDTARVTKKFEKYVVYSKCKRVVIEGIDKICADGEVFASKCADIGILPSSLNIITKQKELALI